MEQLTVERLHSLLIYDPATGEFTHRTARGGMQAGSKAGSLHKRGYWAIGVGGRIYPAHRLAWLYVTGEWPEPLCDHINRNKTDNTFLNLRATSFAVNSQNRGIDRRNKSGHTGVTRHKTCKKWQANIKAAGKAYALGMFDDVDDAAAAYRAAKENLHRS